MDTIVQFYVCIVVSGCGNGTSLKKYQNITTLSSKGINVEMIKSTDKHYLKKKIRSR